MHANFRFFFFIFLDLCADTTKCDYVAPVKTFAKHDRISLESRNYLTNLKAASPGEKVETYRVIALPPIAYLSPEEVRAINPRRDNASYEIMSKSVAISVPINAVS